MAASAAVNGFGTIFAYESAASTYTAFGEVLNVTPPSWNRETIDATHMASDDSYREHIASLFSAGECVVTLNYIEAGMTLLQTIIGAGLESFKITIPGASTIIFNAIPTGVKMSDLQIDDKVTVELTLQPTGKPTFTAV